MPVWGFAVVESEIGGYETPQQKRDAFLRLQREIIAKDGKGIGATFGAAPQDALTWPQSARITAVKLVRRLFGYPLVPEFDLYLEVTADDDRELAQAFRFLDRHCSVEGYTG